MCDGVAIALSPAGLGMFGADLQDVTACLPPHFEHLWSCLQPTQGRPALNVKHTPLTIGCFPLNPELGLSVDRLSSLYSESKLSSSLLTSP